MRHLVVLSYPRSGTTLLTRILNTADGVLIRGETIGAIAHLADFVHILKEVQDNLPRELNLTTSSDLSPIFGTSEYKIPKIIKSIGTVFTEMVLLPEQNTKVIGWGENFLSPVQSGASATIRRLQMLQEFFPNIHFLINIRNPENTAHSEIWKDKPNAINEITIWRDFLIRLHESGKLGHGSTTLAHYEDWSMDPNRALGVLSQLGLKSELQQIRDVLETKLNHLKV